MTPMFSAYVVVGEPPNGARERGGEAVGPDRPAHVGVEVVAGHLGNGLDVAGVLRDQRDHAGQHEQDERHREARAVDDVHAVAESAAAGSRSSPRPRPLPSSRSGRGPSALGPRRRATELIVPKRRSHDPGEQVAEDQRQEDRDPRPEAREHHGGDHHERGGESARSTGPRASRCRRRPGARLKPISITTAPVTAGGRILWISPDAGEVDEHAHGRQHQTGHHDRAGDVGRSHRPRRGWPRRRPRKTRWCRGSSAPVVDDQQEHDRADAGEHDRQVRVKTHHQREDEGRAEHRDDVLGAQTSGLAPAQTLSSARPPHREADRPSPT